MPWPQKLPTLVTEGEYGKTDFSTLGHQTCSWKILHSTKYHNNCRTIRDWMVCSPLFCSYEKALIPSNEIGSSLWEGIRYRWISGGTPDAMTALLRVIRELALPLSLSLQDAKGQDGSLQAREGVFVKNLPDWYLFLDFPAFISEKSATVKPNHDEFYLLQNFLDHSFEYLQCTMFLNNFFYHTVNYLR